MLVGTSPSGPDLKNIFLWSNRTYRDFEMKFQVKLEGGNSGVQFRSHTDLMEQLLVVSGPQANIVGKLWGSLFDEGRSNRWIAQPPPNSQDTVKAKEFNDFYIRCVGNHLTTKVNGVTVLDSSFAEIPDTGIIGFQIRKEERTKEAKVTFRDVVIRELPRAEAGPRSADRAGRQADPRGAGPSRRHQPGAHQGEASRAAAASQAVPGRAATATTWPAGAN